MVSNPLQGGPNQTREGGPNENSEITETYRLTPALDLAYERLLSSALEDSQSAEPTMDAGDVSSLLPIEILFLSELRVQICRNGKRMETLNFAEFGFEDARSGNPDRAWETLVILAKERGIIREGRAASLGVHSFRHTNATAMDSLGIPQQIRKQRLGHSGNSVTENYTHVFAKDERAAAEKLGELFGTGWPEKEQGKVIPFPNLSQRQEWLAGSSQQAITK